MNKKKMLDDGFEDAEKPTLYISGRTKHDKRPVFCVFSPTAKGWKCRSSLRDALNHDYVRKEGLETLRSWALLDYVAGAVMTTSHEEAQALLMQKLDETSSCDRGLLMAPAQYNAELWAERVLTHLKLC